MVEYKKRPLMYDEKKKEKEEEEEEEASQHTLLYHSGLTFKAGTLFLFGTLLAALSSLS